MKTLISLIMFSVVFNISCKTTSINKQNNRMLQSKEYFKDYYSTFWKNDSLGENGFRLLYSNLFIEKNSKTDHSFSELINFFGFPDFIIKNHMDSIGKTSTILSYRLTTLNKKEHQFPDANDLLFNVVISSNDSTVLKFNIGHGE